MVMSNCTLNIIALRAEPVYQPWFPIVPEAFYYLQNLRIQSRAILFFCHRLSSYLFPLLHNVLLYQIFFQKIQQR